MDRLTMAEKQTLLTSIEDDLWQILKKKNEADAEYLDIVLLIQSLDQCQRIQISFRDEFPMIIHSKPIITISDDGKDVYQG